MTSKLLRKLLTLEKIAKIAKACMLLIDCNIDGKVISLRKPQLENLQTTVIVSKQSKYPTVIMRKDHRS